MIQQDDAGSPRAWRIAALVLLAAAFATRAWQFGNPLIHVDENFYLLVGDRMLHGAVPYVDIWDRKPVGLFVLYAAIRLLGGDGIVQYQVVAALFVAATGWVIARLAAPAAGLKAATAAGVAYMLLLNLVGGSGGQAPVFYNLFVAAAALLTFRASSAASARVVRLLGCATMALIGIGLQIKYTVVFEGMLLGILLLLASWRVSKSLVRTAVDAVLWIGLALAPTLLALGAYAAIGQTQAFVYANFLSIGDRSGASSAELVWRLGKAARLMIPMLAAVGLGAALGGWRERPGGPAAYRFALLWLAAAVAGYALFGTYFDHYALPLFAPIALTLAPLFAARPRALGVGFAATLLTVGVAANAVTLHRMHDKRGGAPQMQAMVSAIKPRLNDCLYVWNGDPLLYHFTGSCMPTRYPFSGHLNLLREHGAVAVDQETEVRRILAGKPSVIVDRLPRAKDFNFAVVAIVDAELTRNYEVVETVQLKKSRLLVYARKPGQ